MELETERKNRYFQKLTWIVDHVSYLPPLDEVPENVFYKDALFYRIQTSIEAAMDITAMLCKDLSLIVQDDYSNVLSLKKQGIISSQLYENLKSLNGLRNALVHRYNGLEEEILIGSVEKAIKALLTFTEVIENIIQ